MSDAADQQEPRRKLPPWDGPVPPSYTFWRWSLGITLVVLGLVVAPFLVILILQAAGLDLGGVTG